MPRIGELIVDISATTSKLRANLAQASSLIRDWSLVSTGLTTGVTNAFKQVSAVGIKALQISTIALAGSFGLAAKAGADFEDEIIRAFTILKEGGDAMAGSLSSMISTALELGRETLFSAIQAAQGMQVLARAGFDTREILESIGPTLDLAIVGNMELAESASIVIAALRGFNLETKEASEVADVLALASSKANTTVQELGNAFSYVAPVATGAGLSIEETAAAIGILSNAGIRGSMAGTTLRRALSQLLAPSRRAKKVMNELGVSFMDSTGNLKSFVSIIRDLEKAGMTASQSMKMFGLRAGPGMIALVNSGARSIGELRDSLEDAEGTADRMSQAFRTTVKGRIRDLIASVVDLGLAFSERFRKPLANTIFAVRNFIVDIVNIGNRMGRFRAIVRGLQSTLEPISDLIKELATRFKNWFRTLTPRTVMNFFNTIRKSVKAFVDSLREGEVGRMLKEMFNIIITSGKMALGVLGGIVKTWMMLPEPMRNMLRPVLLVTAGILKLVGGITPLIFQFIILKSLIDALGIKIILGAVVLKGFLAILGVVSLVVGAIGVGIAAWKFGKLIGDSQLLRNTWELIKVSFEFILNLVKNISKGILDWDFSNLLPSLDGMKEKFNAVKESVSEIYDKIKGIVGFILSMKLPGLGPMLKAIGKTTGVGAVGATAGAGEGGGGYMEFGGRQITVAAFEAQQELKQLRSMMGQTDRIGGVMGTSIRAGLLSGLQGRLNYLENTMFEHEANLEALNRQNIKPEADRKNKSRIGAGLE